MKLLLRWLITAAALAAAAFLVPGIHVEGSSAILAVILTALVLGLVNAFIRPILTFLSCGFIVLTMGVFMLVVNALTLWITSWIAVNWFGIGYRVDGFWPALLGSIIVSIVSFILNMFLTDDKRNHT